jgi:hypothetical protein
VQGPWDDPLVFPDPESLIRRSPGAAPLLDAVKDRKTRDAVRSVIERFTGGGQKPAAPEAADGAKANWSGRVARMSESDIRVCAWSRISLRSCGLLAAGSLDKADDVDQYSGSYR